MGQLESTDAPLCADREASAPPGPEPGWQDAVREYVHGRQTPDGTDSGVADPTSPWTLTEALERLDLAHGRCVTLPGLVLRRGHLDGRGGPSRPGIVPPVGDFLVEYGEVLRTHVRRCRRQDATAVVLVPLAVEGARDVLLVLDPGHCAQIVVDVEEALPSPWYEETVLPFLQHLPLLAAAERPRQRRQSVDAVRRRRRADGGGLRRVGSLTVVASRPFGGDNHARMRVAPGTPASAALAVVAAATHRLRLGAPQVRQLADVLGELPAGCARWARRVRHATTLDELLRLVGGSDAVTHEEAFAHLVAHQAERRRTGVRPGWASPPPPPPALRSAAPLRVVWYHAASAARSPLETTYPAATTSDPPRWLVVAVHGAPTPAAAFRHVPTRLPPGHPAPTTGVAVVLTGHAPDHPEWPALARRFRDWWRQAPDPRPWGCLRCTPPSDGGGGGTAVLMSSMDGALVAVVTDALGETPEALGPPDARWGTLELVDVTESAAPEVSRETRMVVDWVRPLTVLRYHNRSPDFQATAALPMFAFHLGRCSAWPPAPGRAARAVEVVVGDDAVAADDVRVVNAARGWDARIVVPRTQHGDVVRWLEGWRENVTPRIVRPEERSTR